MKRFLAKIDLDKMLTFARLIFLRLGAIVLQMLLQLVVGRFTGGYGLGLLQLFVTWTSVLGEVVATGLPTRAMQRVAAMPDDADKAQYRFIRRCMIMILITWLIIVALAVFLAANSAYFSALVVEQQLMWLVIISSLSYAQMRLMSDVLKSRGHTDLAVGAESAGPPLICLLCALAGIVYFSVDAYILIVAYSVGFSLTALLFFFSRIWPLRKSSRNDADISHAIRVNSELFAFAGTGLAGIAFISFPFIVLPYVATVAEVGVFSLGFKLVNLVMTILILLAAIYGPQFARAAANNDAKLLRKILFKTQLVSIALYVPAVLGLVFFNQPILQVFGDEFVAAESFILILLVGQCVNAASGLPSILLNMTHGGRTELFCSLVGLATAAVGCLVLSDSLDALGVAIIYSIAIATKNVLAYGLAHFHISKIAAAQNTTDGTASINVIRKYQEV